MPLKLLYIGSNNTLLKELINRKDLFEVIQVPNGVKAQDLFKKNNLFDAIISEEFLQGINGHSIAILVKGFDFYRNTPFIIVNFEKNKTLKKELFADKKIVDDYFEPPFNVENIAKRIVFLKEYHNKYKDSKDIESVYRFYKIPFLKRAFDIITSLIALIILLPIFIIVAIAIKIESKGPIIYKSKRVGSGYNIFDFYKFRSMYTGADAKLKELEHLNKYKKEQTPEKKSKKFDKLDYNCPRCAKLPEGEFCSPLLYVDGNYICEYWYKKQKADLNKSTFIKIKNDPRITKVGRIIRNTSIDELPQLFNVLKGDMSIVGNRPLPLYEAELLTSDDWSVRFLGPAGITGLWQVELRNKKGEMSEEERKALDNEYAKNYSFWSDIKLIFRTIPALFQKENV
jgi:lipopolysaccharide/colanic/teichoic acid biosynthesis glycosyltransferase